MDSKRNLIFNIMIGIVVVLFIVVNYDSYSNNKKVNESEPQVMEVVKVKDSNVLELTGSRGKKVEFSYDTLTRSGKEKIDSIREDGGVIEYKEHPSKVKYNRILSVEHKKGEVAKNEGD